MRSDSVDCLPKHVQAIREALASFAAERGLPDVPVRGALVFVDAEFGLFPSPFMVDDVWVGWGKAIRKRLAEQTAGELPARDLAKRLARELRAGCGSPPLDQQRADCALGGTDALARPPTDTADVIAPLEVRDGGGPAAFRSGAWKARRARDVGPRLGGQTSAPWRLPSSMLHPLASRT
jgi:hypothetical protein